MAQKNFCDQCGKEISCLRGNDGTENHMIIPYGPEYRWEIDVKIKARYAGDDADLCADCTRTIIFDAVADRDKRRHKKGA